MRRRSRFLYCQNRSSKLAAGSTFLGTTRNVRLANDFQGSRRSEQHSSIPQLPDKSIEMSQTPTMGKLAETAPSALEQYIEVPTELPAASIFTPSQSTAICSRISKASYPLPPLVKKGMNSFQCPCCCQNTSKRVCPGQNMEVSAFILILSNAFRQDTPTDTITSSAHTLILIAQALMNLSQYL